MLGFPFHKNKKSSYESIRRKWVSRHKNLQQALWSKHRSSLKDWLDNSRNFIVGSVAGAILLITPQSAASPIRVAASSGIYKNLDKSSSFLVNLATLTPSEVRPLTMDEENKITKLFTDTFGFKVTAELDGIRLERNYGFIGQEQHLYRYPGDSLDQQLPNSSDAAQFAGYGMAPGLGAYGYFATSGDQITKAQSDREKYYIAVQTFLAPGYDQNPGKYNQFFAFRKVLVVNPDNGKSIVADIGDAGPAVWTGKHLGGSPEVMHYLERVDGAQKGPVLFFFIDDPQNKVPLGPVKL